LNTGSICFLPARAAPKFGHQHNQLERKVFSGVSLQEPSAEARGSNTYLYRDYMMFTRSIHGLNADKRSQAGD
jgi:hypothetical protein